MLKQIQILFVAVTMLAPGSHSYGQTPADQAPNNEPPKTHATDANQPPSNNQRGTDQSPLVIKILPPPQSEQQSTPKAAAQKNQTTDDEKLSTFTEFLFFATLGLAIIAALQLFVFGYQGFQLKRTVDATVAGERPYLYPDHPNYTRFLPSGAKAVYPTAKGVPVPNIEIIFANVGRTSGIIKEMRAEIVLDVLPTVPTFTYSQVRRRGEIIVRSDTITSPTVIEYSRNLTRDEIDEFAVGTRPIFLFGYVKYADAFGFLHTKGFCFQNRLNKPPIELAGGRSYNYSRSERIPDEYAT
jgi:hypothetical protein